MDLFETVAKRLALGENLVLAVITGKTGSGPRSIGTRMAILEDFSIIGTIGGGALESAVLQLAREVHRQRKWLVRNFDLTAEDAVGEGMICGGRIQVLVQFADGSDPSHLDLYSELASSVKANKKSWLITHIPKLSGEAPAMGNGPTPLQGVHSAGAVDRCMLGEVASRAGSSRPEQILLDGELYLVEPLGRGSTVFIFGAGHIARELVPLVKRVGFKTVVLDDRAEYANPHHFGEADRVMVLGSFESGFKGLEIGENSYLVLVTRGHLNDLSVLRQALGTSAGYIGMIGSEKKRHVIFHALQTEGFTKNDLERVHSPIGININAETPAEIAVSIAAELIQIRGRRS